MDDTYNYLELLSWCCQFLARPVRPRHFTGRQGTKNRPKTDRGKRTRTTGRCPTLCETKQHLECHQCSATKISMLCSAGVLCQWRRQEASRGLGVLKSFILYKYIFIFALFLLNFLVITFPNNKLLY
jgi:hypothetical protein